MNNNFVVRRASCVMCSSCHCEEGEGDSSPVIARPAKQAEAIPDRLGTGCAIPKKRLLPASASPRSRNLRDCFVARRERQHAPRNDERQPRNDRLTHYASRTTQYGFTLIELMIVVIIIAALAAMVVPRLSGRTEQAKVTIAEADINSNISMALKLYELDNGNFPTTEQGLNALLSKPSSSPIPTNWSAPYLEKKPVDPWKNPYQYKCPGSHNTSTYDLYSLGKDGAEGTADDVKNWE